MSNFFESSRADCPCISVQTHVRAVGTIVLGAISMPYMYLRHTCHSRKAWLLIICIIIINFASIVDIMFSWNTFFFIYRSIRKILIAIFKKMKSCLFIRSTKLHALFCIGMYVFAFEPVVQNCFKLFPFAMLYHQCGSSWARLF